MRKSDLKVGEEYAVFFSPSEARSSYRRSEPVKAKLVEIGGEIVETFKVVGGARFSYSRHDNPQERRLVLRGMIVELAEPVKRGKISPSGEYVTTGYGRGYSEFVPVEEYEGEGEGVEPRMVTRVALENGGCFVSTWAEYEQEKADSVRAKIQREEQAKLELKLARAREPELLNTLNGVISSMKQRGFSHAFDYPADDDSYAPDDLVFWKGEPRSPYDADVKLNLHYHASRGWVRKDAAVYVGFNVERMRGHGFSELLGS